MSLAEPIGDLFYCEGCAKDLLHCHGALIVHATGEGECTASFACRLGEDAHDFVISCVETIDSCCV